MVETKPQLIEYAMTPSCRLDDSQEELAFLLDLGIEIRPETVNLQDEQKAGYIVTDDESEAFAYFSSLGIDLSEVGIEEEGTQQSLDEADEFQGHVPQADNYELLVQHQDNEVRPVYEVPKDTDNFANNDQNFPGPTRPSSITKSNITPANTNSLSLSDITVVNNVDTANVGARQITSALNSMDMLASTLAKTMEAHMAACNGSDGHKARRVDTQFIQESRERAISNLQATGLLEIIEGKDELTEEETQAVNQVLAVSYGMDSNVMAELPINLFDTEATTIMMPHLAEQAFAAVHEHNASCNHGGEAMAGMGISGITMPGFAGDGNIFKSSDHSHHNFFCKKCKKVVHLHGATCSCGAQKRDLVALSSPEGKELLRASKQRSD